MKSQSKLYRVGWQWRRICVPYLLLIGSFLDILYWKICTGSRWVPVLHHWWTTLYLLFYSLNKIKPKTKTKIQNIFCWCKWKLNNFFYMLWIEGTRKHLFLKGKKGFLVLSIQSTYYLYKKSKCQQQKNLVFSFWFLFIQQIKICVIFYVILDLLS